MFIQSYKNKKFSKLATKLDLLQAYKQKLSKSIIVIPRSFNISNEKCPENKLKTSVLDSLKCY